MTVVSDESTRCTVDASAGVTAGAAGTMTKATFRADIVADLTIEEQLYGAAQALPSATSAEKARRNG